MAWLRSGAILFMTAKTVLIGAAVSALNRQRTRDPPRKRFSDLALPRESASDLDQLEHLAACAEASGSKPAKSPGAAVERYREVPLYEAALLTVDPSDDAPKSFERAPEFENVVASPPERVPLRG